MELKEVLENRKSCRKYDELAIISEHIINEIIWAGTRAPYGSRGPRREIVHIRDKETKMKLQEACHNQKYVGSCDTVIIGLGKETNGEKHSVLKSGHSKYIFDVSASIMCMDLMATSHNLGTCWIGWFKAEEVKKILNTNLKPTIILLIGEKK